MSGTIDLTDPRQMQAFVAALRQAGVGSGTQGGGGGGGNQGGSTPSRRTNFQGQAREAFSGFADFLGQAGGSVDQFARSTLNTVPVLNLFSGVVGDATQFLTRTNDTFRNLSSVGAGFNGDLGALRAAAANTRMPLDQFANLVGRNSQQLTALGAGVNGGTRRFAELSRAMFEDGNVIGGMLNLGYNIEQANEMLLEQASLNSRSFRAQGMNDAQIAQATLAMAENIAVMAEISGESREAARQKLMEEQRDGKTIAALRLAEMNGALDAQQRLTQASTAVAVAGDDARALLQDYVHLGAPATDATREFAALNPELAATMQEMANLSKVSNDVMSAQEKERRMAILNERFLAQSAAVSRDRNRLQIATTGSVNRFGASMADTISSLENYSNSVEENQQALQRQENEAARREGRAARTITRDMAAANLLQRTRENVESQMAGGADGQAISRELNMSTIALANSAATVNSEIARNLSANTTLQNNIAESLAGLRTVAQGVGIAGAATVSGLTPGSVDPASLATNQFRTLFEPLISNGSMNTNITNFGEILAQLGTLTPDQIEDIIRIEQERRRAEEEGRAVGGPIRAGRTYNVGEQGPETIIPGTDGTVIPNMRREFASLRNAMMSAGMPVSEEQQRQLALGLESRLGNLMPNIRNISPRRQDGTTGPQFDPRELVETMRQSLGSINLDLSTEKTEQLLDSLNQSMLQLININSTQVRNQTRHTNAIKGAGNLLQGVAVR